MALHLVGFIGSCLDSLHHAPNVCDLLQWCSSKGFVCVRGRGSGSGEVIRGDGLLGSLLRWEMVGWCATWACWGKGMVCCNQG